MNETELKTKEEFLAKYPGPWTYQDWNGDILDTKGQYIMCVYDDGLAEIILEAVEKLTGNKIT